jgi:hypothetical protein
MFRLAGQRRERRHHATGSTATDRARQCCCRNARHAVPARGVRTEASGRKISAPGEQVSRRFRSVQHPIHRAICYQWPLRADDHVGGLGCSRWGDLAVTRWRRMSPATPGQLPVSARRGRPNVWSATHQPAMSSRIAMKRCFSGSGADQTHRWHVVDFAGDPGFP